MNMKVDDLMVRDVVVARPTDVVGELRDRMMDNGISALPVVDGAGHPIGIVTATDLLEEHPPQLGVVEVMSTKVLVVPRYEDVHIAARVMRNHHIHHVVVTEGREVLGVLSSFDLLRLVEEHRFVMKQPPTEPVRHGHQRV